MRSIFVAILSVFIFASSANAENAKFYGKVYDLINKEYLHSTSYNELVAKGFMGLSEMDKNIKVSNGETTITLYYKGKAIKSLPKPSNPEDLNNADAWGDLTIKAIAAAASASPEIKKRDFEAPEYFLASLFRNLDKDTKYYPYLEIENSNEGHRQRYFADRIIDKNILYMKLGPLNSYTKENIIESFSKNKDFKSLIIDLRGNPGGLLSEAVEIVKVFLDGGIVASSKSKSDNIMKYYTADENAESAINGKPVVVLVDGDTASSAEVLAAALKEQGLAKIVGTNTKGKGTVQKLFKLDNGGELALTTAYFYTPSGRNINEVGVFPNVCTAYTTDSDDVKSHLDSKMSRSNNCEKQSRKNREFDIDVAVELLK